MYANMIVFLDLNLMIVLKYNTIACVFYMNPDPIQLLLTDGQIDRWMLKSWNKIDYKYEKNL